MGTGKDCSMKYVNFPDFHVFTITLWKSNLWMTKAKTKTILIRVTSLKGVVISSHALCPDNKSLQGGKISSHRPVSSLVELYMLRCCIVIRVFLDEWRRGNLSQMFGVFHMCTGIGHFSLWFAHVHIRFIILSPSLCSNWPPASGYDLNSMSPQ